MMQLYSKHCQAVLFRLSAAIIICFKISKDRHHCQLHLSESSLKEDLHKATMMVGVTRVTLINKFKAFVKLQAIVRHVSFITIGKKAGFLCRG